MIRTTRTRLMIGAGFAYEQGLGHQPVNVESGAPQYNFFIKVEVVTSKKKENIFLHCPKLSVFGTKLFYNYITLLFFYYNILLYCEIHFILYAKGLMYIYFLWTSSWTLPFPNTLWGRQINLSLLATNSLIGLCLQAKRALLTAIENIRPTDRPISKRYFSIATGLQRLDTRLDSSNECRYY